MSPTRSGSPSSGARSPGSPSSTSPNQSRRLPGPEGSGVLGTAGGQERGGAHALVGLHGRREVGRRRVPAGQGRGQQAQVLGCRPEGAEGQPGHDDVPVGIGQQVVQPRGTSPVAKGRAGDGPGWPGGTGT